MKKTATYLLSLFVLALALSACSTDDPAGTGSGGDAGGTDGGSDTITDDAGGDTDGDSCSSNADCPDPQVCQLDTATGELSCQDPGGGETGDSCTTGADCASGVCLNGACADTCASDGDCPSGYACETQSVPLDDGGTADVDVCIETDRPCASDEDCTDPQICTVDRSGSSTDLTCGAPIGGGQLGDSCTADADCASNLCVEDQCSAPCERTIDCNDGDGFKCEPTEIDLGAGGTEEQNICRPKAANECSSDSDCSGSDRCVAEKTATQIEFTCGAPNQGGGETGADCAADDECAQNLCMNAKCAGPCASEGDCSAASDYACEITEVTLTGGTDNAEICVPPRDCASDAECRVGEVCYIDRTNSGIESSCKDPNTGGGQLGDRCTEDTNCLANLCYDGRFGQVCSNPCSDDSDCPSAGYECVTTSVEDSSGAQSSATICAPKDPPSCTSQSDCATGLSCAVIENSSGNALVTACIPSAGGTGTGVACNDDSECASRVCLNGNCAAPCTSNNQCGQDQLCEENGISKSGLSGTFDLCETLGEEQCDDDGACDDGTRLCSELRIDQSTNTQEAYCRFPVTGGDPLGSTCSTGTDCRTGLCLSSVSAECSVACVNDGQCAAEQVCTGIFGENSARICLRGCSDNDDCSALNTGGDTHLCTISEDAAANEIDQVCRKEVTGGGDLGAACSTNQDCASGMCLTNTQYTSTACTSDSQCSSGQVCVPDPSGTGNVCADEDLLCTHICDDASDCSGGISGNELTACAQDITVTLQNGTTDTISACAKP
ncbi:MAG: hypothetical protein ACQEVA_05610 [Myxococcota bacterium]